MIQKVLNYFRQSLSRKRARSIKAVYPFRIDTFELEQEGIIQFANWTNPLGINRTMIQGEVNFFRRFAVPGSCCIDIGANIGDTTVPMALSVGPEGLTIAFEPNPLVYEGLKANALLNKGKVNIITIPYAVTETDGNFFYNSSEASFGYGGVSADKNEALKHGKFQLDEQIQGVNLESYLNKHYLEYLPKLSFIKIDVEGHDKDIIRSIYSLIEQYKPAIVAEVFDYSTAEERLELFDLVAIHKYNIFYFYEFMDSTEIYPLKRDDMISKKNFNFYAIPTGYGACNSMAEFNMKSAEKTIPDSK